MIRLFTISVVAMALGGCAEPSARSPEKINLKILYAGVLGDARTTEFVSFLKHHFVTVGETSYSDFKPDAADRYDVVIFDAEAKVNPQSIGLPSAPQVPPDFERASVLVGGAGVLAAFPLRLKLDWLCMCLAKSAHGMVSRHEIFQSPLPVDLRTETIPMPKHYGGSGTLDVWKVNTKDYLDKEVAMKPGVVSTGAGFTDSPDAEFISGGVNQKGREAVAIGRQGPFLLWGFAAAPNGMTPSGRNAFVNAVAYIAKFDRRPVLVRKTAHSRDYALLWAESIARVADDYKEECEYIRSENLRRKQLVEAGKTRPLPPLEKALADSPEMPVPSFEEFRKAAYAQLFPSELVESLGYDASKYLAYYQENRPYLTYQNHYFVLDDDARAVGIGNSDPRLLDHCVACLERGVDVARATRLLMRYTGEEFATPPEWISWHRMSRADLFFSDVGGFRFYGNVGLTETVRRRALARSIQETSESRPVVLHAEITPATAEPGEIVTLVVRLRIATGWHVYAAAPLQSGSQATQICMEAPPELIPRGEWLRPPGKPFESGRTIYSGEVILQHKLLVGKVNDGKLEVPVQVSYEACNSDRCLPPASRKITTSISILKKRPAESED
ncbi:MAG: hypothetical protein JO332_05830 [Planctomycetaceae bacterium]|nr:hypothetical protein [Planctomycetaceae bacterium]